MPTSTTYLICLTYSKRTFKSKTPRTFGPDLISAAHTWVIGKHLVENKFIIPGNILEADEALSHWEMVE